MESFDERAATWDDDPAKWERARDVAAAIDAALDLRGDERLLEYGAGTGLVTQALRAKVGPVTLADTSEGMRRVIHDKIAAGAITDATVWDVDLETTDAPDTRFDLIVTVMTLHHIDDVRAVLSRFRRLLPSAGHLCVVDLEHDEHGAFHGPDADVHHGFERTELTEALEAAGFADIVFEVCHTIERHGGTFPVFLATATPA